MVYSLRPASYMILASNLDFVAKEASVCWNSCGAKHLNFWGDKLITGQVLCEQFCSLPVA